MFLKREITVPSLTGTSSLLEINVVTVQTTTSHTSGNTHTHTHTPNSFLLVLWRRNNTKYPIRDDQKIIRNDHLENKSGRNSEATVSQEPGKM